MGICVGRCFALTEKEKLGAGDRVDDLSCDFQVVSMFIQSVLKWKDYRYLCSLCHRVILVFVLNVVV